MKHKKSIVSIVFLFVVSGGVYAQENTSASGGEATGSGGTASYSVGQIVYTTNIGTNGSVSQGVQQTFQVVETTTVLGEENAAAEISVYPNPVVNYFTLQVGSQKFETISYQLMDVQGRIIEEEKLEENNTTINMEGLSQSTYFLKVVNDKNKSIKVFKIIKK